MINGFMDGYNLLYGSVVFCINAIFMEGAVSVFSVQIRCWVMSKKKIA